MSDSAPISSRQLYLRLLRHVRPYWRQFSFAIGAMVLLALTEPAIPALLKPLLDGTFVERNPAYIAWTPLALVGLFLIRGISNFASEVTFEWISGRVVLDLRQHMFHRILNLATPYYDGETTGNLVSKVTYNVSQVTQAATRVLTVVVKDSIIVIGLVGYMLWLNWLLTVGVFILIPIIGGMVRIVAIRMRKLSRTLQQTVGDMTHVLEESVRGHKVIKVFGGQAQEASRFRENSNWVRRLNVKLKVADASNGPVVELAGAIMLASLIYVGTSQTAAGTLTVGGFMAFLTAIGLLFPPIKRLTGVNQPLQRGLAAAESVFGLIDQPPERDEGTIEVGRVAGRLEFVDVGFRYDRTSRAALEGVSFTVEPGQTLALVGASGSGKTTIANLIPRFYNPDQGRILLDGVDIQEMTLASLRANLSMVGQDPMLFNDSVAANIAFGRSEPVPQAELERIAKAAHALDYIRQLPEGFDTLVGEDGIRLSGGQRQRLAIARALMKDAPVLILDEATSALDSESEGQVQAALRELTANRTTIVIAHRLSTIEHADRILVVRDGRIVESGAHRELLAQNGEYSRLYNTQFKTQDEGV